MQRCTVALLFVCAGCKFSVHALTGIGDVADLAVVDDLATGGGGGSGGGGTSDDLATILDLAMPAGPPDLVPDPCVGAPALGNGNVAAQCVIGTPPTIDGNLADWPINSFLPMTKTTSAQATGTWDVAGIPNDTNSSARWLVRWDLSYLYVAVSVTDDVQNTPNPAGSQISENDAIEIFVDGGHERSSTYDGNDWQLVYSADGAKQAAQLMLKSWPAGPEVWSRTSPSWTLEAAIPWSILGGTASLGRLVGFDLKLDDNDSGTMRERDLVLYYGQANGNGGCTAPNCRTDVYGTVQLQGR
ncbi:MAG TPA: sugar-binding protein [Polyangia bacterium]